MNTKLSYLIIKLCTAILALKKRIVSYTHTVFNQLILWFLAVLSG
jgi:hypothetical protein